MEKLIGYCGLNCAECGAYIAMKNDDWALREKTAIEWSKTHNTAFTPEMINCVGCKNEGAKIDWCANHCPVRKCASEKGVLHCGTCIEFKTCKIINDFIANAPNVLENLLGGN